MLAWLAATTLQAIDVTRITCETAERPLALSASTPRFGWQLEGEAGTMQSAYAVEVYTRQGDSRTVVWESGKTASDQSQWVPYGGTSLRPMERYFWRVRVWDEQDRPSAWSREGEFRLAPRADFFDARWIGAITNQDACFPEGRIYEGARLKKAKAAWDAVDSLAWRSICLRKDFTASRRVASATAYVCGLGHYELTLNGTKVGDGEFTPLISDYDKTVYYNTYDVTDLVKPGANAAGVLLGNGFYNVMGGGRYRKLQVAFGAPTLLFQLVIDYADGTREVVKSGADWKYALSPITFNTLYGGEDYDARLEQPGWDCPGFDDTAWKPVVLQEAPRGALCPQQAPPVKIMERYDVQRTHKLTPAEVDSACVSTKRTVDPSALMFDMGQNLAGFPEITVQGKRGQQVTILVGEALTPEHAVNQRQTGRQYYYTYTLKGDGVETWHPRFTYYGFRYIQVEGAVMKGQKNPRKLPVIRKIQSCFVYNSAPQTGHFECSNPIFTAAHRLIDRAVRSNMQGVFTDCPHREKLGWLEQAHLMQFSVQYRYNMARMYGKIMADMRASQTAEGMIPDIAPEYVEFEGGFRDTPEWGSAFIISPWYVYQWYGDSRLVEKYYPAMQEYLRYLQSQAKDNIVAYGLGDWFDIGPGSPGFSQLTSNGVTATAIYYYDVCLMEKMAGLLGRDDDEARYAALAAQIKESFNAAFWDPETKTYDRNSQTANAIALFMGLTTPENHNQVFENLVADIRGRGNALTAGDVGYRYVLRALEENGASDIIYDMNSKYDTPGYGWQLAHGATALTESWQAYGFVSNNHFMLGHLMEWLFSGLGGIRQSEESVAFRHVVVKPSLVGDVRFARTSYESPYGTVVSDWKDAPDTYTIKVEVPANSFATVHLPTSDAGRVTESGVELEGNYSYVAADGGGIAVGIGSGIYRFEVRK